MRTDDTPRRRPRRATLRPLRRMAVCVLVCAGASACMHDGDDIKLCVMYPRDVQAAIDACTRLIDHKILVDPQRQDWFAARANHRLKAGDPHGALADIDEALRLRPDDPGLKEERTEILQAEHDAAKRMR